LQYDVTVLSSSDRRSGRDAVASIFQNAIWACDRAVVLFSDVSYMHANAKAHLTIIRKVRSQFLHFS